MQAVTGSTGAARQFAHDELGRPRNGSMVTIELADHKGVWVNRAAHATNPSGKSIKRASCDRREPEPQQTPLRAEASH